MKRNRQLILLAAFCMLIASSTSAQQKPSADTREKLLKIYNGIKKPEISFEKFYEINEHVYSNEGSGNVKVNAVAPITINALPSDTYCGKVRPYCTNSDFENGLDQNQYTGAYGLWSASLYPNPFALTYGFISGALTSSSSHQTIVNKSSGVDPIAGIPVVPPNGGNQALRLGNAVNGLGTEIIAKTVTVDANENILGFYYAVVLQDPGHDHDDQPAFIVRAYDCSTGLELPNVVDLGDGSNTVVADANNPFFENKIYQSERLVYRNWSKVQVDLSRYVGKNVVIVFNVKDCNLSGHFGYAYVDNLFSTSCPAPPEPPLPGTNPGQIELDTIHTSTCATGNICAKYVVPSRTTNGVTTVGNIVISLDIYQNGNLVKNVNSPTISTHSSDSTYCFSVDPATLGINTSLGGFDYKITGRFALTGTQLSPGIVGNTGTGVKSGINNDYLVICGSNPPPPPPPPGSCPISTIIAADPLTCKATLSWAEPSLLFPDSISVKNGVNQSSANLIYKGTYNGHGYYESTDQYLWTDARDAAIAVGGHLVTITDAAENNFVGTNIMEQNNYAWIGLYNTGTVGSFAWVTGEPVGYTNWIPGEPNNLYNDNSNPTVYEPYVHINGYDSLSRWNDIGNTVNPVNAQFIGEFENAIYAYRKISGPSNGDIVGPGVYTICYERTNTITGAKDSCCFTITVTCSSISKGCPADTVIVANPSTCMAKVSWTIPTKLFPDSISLGATSGSLTYKGTYNGHGYYQSTDLFKWTDAKNAAGSVGGHLVTITDAAENTFVSGNLDQTNNFAWIGLYNTGTVGSFAWVTGEPLSYTNWLTGEPNNLYNQPANPTVFEPYVQINGWYDNTNRWNDVGDVSSIFLAEFDNAALTYRQISGPVNGDSLAAGVYTVCYEILNNITHTADTCCFNITVVCNNTTTPANSIISQSARMSEDGLQVFNAVAYPNPSNTSFKLRINSNNSSEKVIMKVTDITGRMIEMNNTIKPGNTVSFGNRYTPGIYFTTITQGSKVIVMKLVKQ